MSSEKKERHSGKVMERRVMDYLQTRGMTKKEVAEALDESISTIRDVIYRLMKQGKVVIAGKRNRPTGKGNMPYIYEVKKNGL